MGVAAVIETYILDGLPAVIPWPAKAPQIYSVLLWPLVTQNLQYCERALTVRFVDLFRCNTTNTEL